MIFAQAPQSFRNRNVLERELLFGHGPGGEKNIDSMCNFFSTSAVVALVFWHW